MWTALWVFISALAVALIAPMIAHAIKLSEFRQAWINDLRKDIAEYVGLSRRWARNYETYFDLTRNNTSEEILREKEEEVTSLINEARVIEWRIQMRINPLESATKQQDDLFLEAIANLTTREKILPEQSGAVDRWNDLADVAISRSRELLKREWEVTKQFLPRWLQLLRKRLKIFAGSRLQKTP